MNHDVLWWHLNGANSKKYYSDAANIVPELSNEAYFMFGELGKTLSKYGLVNHREQVNGAWLMQRESHIKTAEERLSYAYSISFSDKICNISKEYVALINKSKKINEEISNLEVKKKMENVEEWWIQL